VRAGRRAPGSAEQRNGQSPRAKRASCSDLSRMFERNERSE
jgi:hypothetical protein